MIKQRKISLGSPWSPGGSTYVATRQDDLLQMAVDFEYLRLREDDVIVTPSLHVQIEDRVLREQVLLKSNITALGIPKKLTNLFQIQSKSNAEKYCRNLELDEFELFLLIHNCAQINFKHEAKFREHIPKGRDITADDQESLHNGKFRQFTSKLISLLKFRKQSHVHWFECDKEWHLFYFDYTDTAEHKEGHWEAPHLHYPSHLWTHSKKDEILKAFDQRRTNRSGYHVKFVPFEYSSPLDRRRPPVTIFGSQPMLLVINSRLPTDPITTPIPTAHIATRGVWVQSIALVPRRPNNPE